MSYGISEPFLQKIVPILFLTQFPKAFELLKLMSQEEYFSCLLLQTRNEKPVGICSFGKSRPADFPDRNEIYSIYILPGYTGQGFGEALLDFALAELKETECAGIYLLVFKENYSGRHFYEKYGFIFTEEFSSCTLDETAVPEIKYVYKKQGRD